MKSLFLCLLLTVFVRIGFSQKTIYDPNALPRELKGYHAIAVSDGIDVYLSYGEEVVVVSASEEKYRDRIKTAVQNGVLKISYEERGGISWNTNRKLKAYISYKNLDALAAAGGCDIFVDGILKASELNIHISGGSDFKGAVNVQALNIAQSGGSDVDITGTAGKVSLSASGGSDFNGYGLTAEICSVEASGGSDVEITVNKELSAHASGASDITYKGAASVSESKTSGASSVTRKS